VAHRRGWIGFFLGAALAIGVAAAAKAGTLIAGNAVFLDRVAFAIDGAESSHGADPNMWRADIDGPQGPMQVSAAAAADVGGGDRFDPGENRALGRAYLARLYRRYANWPDAIAAYNWGPGNMDSWINAGRPIDKFPIAVSLYRIRVLFGPSLPAGALATPRLARLHPRPRRSLADLRHPSHDSIAVEQLYTEIMAESEHVAR